jgi:hypothetical protein
MEMDMDMDNEIVDLLLESHGIRLFRSVPKPKCFRHRPVYVHEKADCGTPMHMELEQKKRVRCYCNKLTSCVRQIDKEEMIESTSSDSSDICRDVIEVKSWAECPY